MKREPSIELLRGILMLMIVLTHLTGNGVLKYDAPISYTEPNWLCANIIDALCYPAVNTFVLISGYFGIRLSLTRVLKLDVPVIAYSVVLFALFGTISLGGAISSLIPILSSKYWFLTSYFLLMLVSPFLNAFIETRSQSQLRNLFLWSIFIFVLIPSFSPFSLSDLRGMDVINFGVIYIVGRCLAISKFNLSKRKSVLLYIISTLIILSLTGLFAFKFGINRGWKSYFYAYNNIFVYAQAIGLFFLFKQIKLDLGIGKIINWLAPSFFFVYIIHSNPVIVNKLYVWISSSQYYYSNLFVLHTLGWALVIFIICILVDIVFHRLLLNSIIAKTIDLIELGINRIIKLLPQ